VYAREGSTVHAWAGSTVYAREGSTVYASDIAANGTPTLREPVTT
jgi:hypothetical protein